MRRDTQAQLQLLEAITVAVFIFIAIATVSIFRLPSSPGTFEQSELATVARNTLEVLQARAPQSTEDCNESPCPFDNSLDRMVSLALGYRGPTYNATGEDANTTELDAFLGQALPPGARYIFAYSNGDAQVQLTPLNVSPPAAPVAVARTVGAPNWTTFVAGLNNTVIVRTNEFAGFGTLTSLQDPLNRTSTEAGAAWTSLFATRVPLNATFGTWRACMSATCYNVTIVPQTTAGTGSQVVGQERDVYSSLTTLGTWADLIYVYDAAPIASYGSEDRLYLHLGAGETALNHTVSGHVVRAGDVRLSRLANCRTPLPGVTLACPPGSMVRSGDLDQWLTLGQNATSHPTNLKTVVLRESVTNNNLVDEGETAYLDMNANGKLDTGDFRISRDGVNGTGTAVSCSTCGPAGTDDAFSASTTILYADLNGTGALDEGEPLYLDLQGLGQQSGLDKYDLHLSTIGAATQRYLYDFKLVVWYGV